LSFQQDENPWCRWWSAGEDRFDCFLAIPSATSSTFAFVMVFEELQAETAKANTAASAIARNNRPKLFAESVIAGSISSVALAHHEVQTAENGDDVAEGTAGQKFGQDAEIHNSKGGGVPHRLKIRAPRL